MNLLKCLRCGYSFLVQVCAGVVALAACGASGETLNWGDCVKEALKGNQELVSASESVRQAEAGVAASRGRLMPEVKASAGAGRGGRDGSGTDNSFSYGVSASQLVYDAGKTSSDTRRLEEQLQALRFRYDLASAGVRRNLRLAFSELLKARRQVTLTEGILARRKQSTRLIRLRYEGGREHKGSLLTAEAKEAQSEFELSQANRNVAAAQSNLRRLLGRPPGSQDDIVAGAGCDVANVDVGAPDFAGIAESTPLVRALLAEQVAARYGVKSAKADFFPSVYADAGASRSESDWPPKEDQWSAGLSVSLPLFDGWSRNADLDRARSAVRQAEAGARGAVQDAAAQLQARWIGLRNAVGRVGVREKFLVAARERAKIAQGQYSASIIGFDSWIIIEDEFVQAEQALLEAQAASLVAEAEWIQAKGGTLENDAK